MEVNNKLTQHNKYDTTDIIFKTNKQKKTKTKNWTYLEFLRAEC